MQSRRTQRESVNAELPSRRALEENRRVAIFQSVIAGDVDFHDDAKRRDMLAMAKRCLEAVLVRCHGQPRAGERCEITRRTSSGASVVMDTGLDEAGFVRKMEETIVRLSRSRIPNDEEMAIRREFKELPTQQARAQWIGRLWGSENPVDAHKARTVAVMVLHERGVADAGVICLLVRIVTSFWPALSASALRSRISRICWRESGLRLRSISCVSTAFSGARPSCARTLAISSAWTPPRASASTNACLTAITSAWESETLFLPVRET